MKLSELNPEDIETPSLKLSELDPNEVQKVPRETPNVSILESGARGVQQGLTGGFSDELGGVGATIGDYLASKAYDLPTNPNTYSQERDRQRALNQKAQEDHGIIYGASNLAGSLAPAIATGGESLLGNVASGAAQGGLSAVGASNSSDPIALAKEAALGSLVGGTAGGVGYGLTKIPGALKNAAESFKLNATGATGKQIENFQPGAARELFDRKIGGWFSSPADIAKEASQGLDEAGAKIETGLSGLTEHGAKIDAKELRDGLQSEINSLAKDESQTAVRKQLEGILENIPEDSRTLTDVERVKRGFQRLSNYNDLDATLAKKKAASVYQNAVESKALETNPKLASLFKEGKEDWKLLAPIEEAATRRANVLNQQHFGGLLDTAAMGVGGLVLGEAVGGHKGGLEGLALGLGGAGLRRAIAPRVSSFAAHGTDFLAKLARGNALGKFKPVVEKALQRGPQAAAATHFILSSQYPSYREMTDQVTNEE